MNKTLFCHRWLTQPSHRNLSEILLLTVSVLPLEMSFSLMGESFMLATFPAELDTFTTLDGGNSIDFYVNNCSKPKSQKDS